MKAAETNPQDLVDLADMHFAVDESDEACRCMEKAARMFVNFGHWYKAAATCVRLFVTQPDNATARVILSGLIDRQLVDHAKVGVKHASAGAMIFSAGEATEDLVLLIEGSVRLFAGNRTDEGALLDLIEPGGMFGELALLGDGKRHTSALADSDCTMLWLQRRRWERLRQDCKATDDAVRATYRDRLRRFAVITSPILSNLERNLAQQILKQGRPVAIPPGQTISEERDQLDSVYLVLIGQLNASIQQNGEERCLGALHDGDIFAEGAIQGASEMPFTVKSETFCQLLKLEPAPLADLVAAHPEVGEQIAAACAARDRQYNLTG